MKTESEKTLSEVVATLQSPIPWSPKTRGERKIAKWYQDREREAAARIGAVIDGEKPGVSLPRSWDRDASDAIGVFVNMFISMNAKGERYMTPENYKEFQEALYCNL